MVKGILVSALCCAIAPAGAFAQSTPRGSAHSVALVLTYKCRPENRPRLREQLEGAAGTRIAQWQAQEKLADALVLFGLDANDDLWDALVLLRFEGWPQYWTWKDIERTFPAGLSSDALALTTGVTSTLSEVAWEGRVPAAKKSAARSVYFVRPYYFDDADLYRRFFDAYNKPQFEAWLREGALNRYWGLLNQNPTGNTWGVTLIYEYPGWEAAAGRAGVKAAVAPGLRADPAWSVLGEVKGSIRKSGRVTLAERIGPGEP